MFDKLTDGGGGAQSGKDRVVGYQFLDRTKPLTFLFTAPEMRAVQKSERNGPDHRDRLVTSQGSRFGKDVGFRHTMNGR